LRALPRRATLDDDCVTVKLCQAMKNITVAVDDETYRLARIAAAERNTSVSALVRDYLKTLVHRSGDDADAAKALFSALDRAKSFRAAGRLTREEVHAR
jgi:hypothetical protein